MANIDPDEGVVLNDGLSTQVGAHGPYIQSQRLEIYKKHAQKLIENGNAYYAFDTKEELDAMRAEMLAAGNPAPKYDASVRRRMRNSLTLTKEETEKLLKEGHEYVIRMIVPETEIIEFTDDIRGTVQFQGHTVDDQVLMKSDGFPTYHLAHVVDDHLMEIDLVLRGEEWLSSLPKHLLLFQYFGWQPPRYAHVSLLLNKDKSKLSKRQNDVAAEDYIAKGYLPEVLLNFLALLGWNPGTTQEIFSLSELIDAFSLERVQKAGAIFDIEKLDWLQGQWMRKFSTEEFAARIRPVVSEVYAAALNDANFEAKAKLIHDRITFFKEAPEMMSFFYTEPAVSKELMANKKQKVTEADLPKILSLLSETLTAISDADWTEDNLHKILFATAEEKGLSKGQILWPLRALLTGLPFSPGAFEVAAALGKKKTLERLERAQKEV
jgi:glutamyl-tRNA synthetase